MKEKSVYCNIQYCKKKMNSCLASYWSTETFNFYFYHRFHVFLILSRVPTLYYVVNRGRQQSRNPKKTLASLAESSIKRRRSTGRPFWCKCQTAAPDLCRSSPFQRQSNSPENPVHLADCEVNYPSLPNPNDPDSILFYCSAHYYYVLEVQVHFGITQIISILQYRNNKGY